MFEPRNDSYGLSSTVYTKKVGKEYGWRICSQYGKQKYPFFVQVFKNKLYWNTKKVYLLQTKLIMFVMYQINFFHAYLINNVNDVRDRPI